MAKYQTLGARQRPSISVSVNRQATFGEVAAEMATEVDPASTQISNIDFEPPRSRKF
ncbi:hypothetical protein GJ744_007454 [Endocarpon pusillum]|uniref:Uncharacterized protein n=1 Tax=Endocarpon pusillum TaxID=364733 RepID=A0A8H7AKE7_9EURO|nr:hypothetical protein GJ744_007454 [Endocarpon pusillum]